MNRDVLQLIEKFYSKELITKSFYNSFDNYKSLVLDLCVSDNCNLKCKHCYFGKTTAINKHLTLQEWTNIIDSFYKKGCKHFHFSGKESSLSDIVPKLCQHIKSIDKTNFCGIISNACGDIEFYNSISKYIDYMEISIDGSRRKHDFLRGKGSYEIVQKKIHDIIQIIDPDKINMATSFYNDNLFDFLEIVSEYSKFGINKFFGSPILPIGNAITISDKLITQSDYSKLIGLTKSYLLETKENINIFFCINHDMIADFWDNDAYMNKLFLKFLRKGVNVDEKINNNWLQFSFEFFDIPYLYQIVVSTDGYILPRTDCFCNSKYDTISLGNILDVGIDAILEKRRIVIKDAIYS